MTTQRVLTGITTTGTPHLGNYVGAIRPAIKASRNSDTLSFYFLADYHALIKCRDPELIQQSTREVAASWLAAGLDPDKVIFYRQSDVPEIAELCWLLNCMTAKGLMNRAHAYKAAVAANQEAGEDPDYGITLGLYSYPVLMAADILLFNAHQVPVGKDQIQHVEMARDIAARFNHHYGEHFVLPEAVVDENVAVLQGLDGRKMSKSYNNTIPLFLGEKQLKKHINKIKTNLLEPGEPKDPDDSTVFQLWQAFATKAQAADMREAFVTGIAWGEAKRRLFELINEELAEAREHYNSLMERPGDIEEILMAGAEKARIASVPFLRQLREAMGIRPLG
jgi:tryptophanyl-tRNA synthetase